MAESPLKLCVFLELAKQTNTIDASAFDDSQLIYPTPWERSNPNEVAQNVAQGLALRAITNVDPSS